jgi:ABC-type phosphate transport system substrate-binding protein
LLSLNVLADILLGNIDSWNHTLIAELNPDLEDVLPAEPITVINYDDDSLTIIFAVLSQVNAEFQQAVIPLQLLGLNLSSCVFSPPYDIYHQVQGNATKQLPILDPWRALSLPSDAKVTVTLLDTPYAMILTAYDAVRPIIHLGFADMVNVAGQRVSPSYASLMAAGADYFATGQPFLGAGYDSWPLPITTYILFHKHTMIDCTKAKGMASVLYFLQSDPKALEKTQYALISFIPHFRTPPGLFLLDVVGLITDAVSSAGTPRS